MPQIGDKKFREMINCDTKIYEHCTQLVIDSYTLSVIITSAVRIGEEQLIPN